MAADLIQNRNWRNEKIYGEGGSGLLKYVGGYFVPYSLQGIQRNVGEDKGTVKTVAPLFGVNAASKSMGQTKAEEYMQNAIAERAPGTRKQQTERNQAKSEITRAVRTGNMDRAAELAQAAIEAGTITLDDANHALESSTGSRLEADFKRLTLNEQIEAMARANPDERKQLGELFMDRLNRNIGKLPPAEQEQTLQKMVAAGLLEQYRDRASPGAARGTGGYRHK